MEKVENGFLKIPFSVVPLGLSVHCKPCSNKSNVVSADHTSSHWCLRRGTGFHHQH